MSSANKKFIATKKASQTLVDLSEQDINKVLEDFAELLLAKKGDILTANAKDLSQMEKSDPCYDRLQLTEERIEGIASDVKNVASLPYPVGEILEEKKLPNGLELSKVSVPLGVIGVIYEARPNVTCDVFSLCFKSGNACVLKGGKEAQHSNEILVEIIQEVLQKHSIDENIVCLLSNDRQETAAMLEAHGQVDVIIPRGGHNLINFVRENSKVPVIETGAGIVHTYFDASGDLAKGQQIIFNAKTYRPSVCNALDTLVVHQDRLNDLPELLELLAKEKVEILADEKAYEALKGKYSEDLLKKADENSFGTEFLSLKMSIKTVADVQEAVDHIDKYSSQHSEAIIADDQAAIDYFIQRVDAAAVYANTSTVFTDGAQFGLGAEIGISTQKLHARGPMGLKELTSYKWVIRGEGQVRPT
ncbi:MAG: glutamate-5-semialdehyde dehydrogenase [Parcubacteria group bacterium]|nr:glutamate-5-semialdehyde dehydrogenase [Parcubacteria group bacterium]